jgi:5-methylcytosine-specific restriction enzyme A
MGTFTPRQLLFFNATSGAGSVVTDREEYDSQITIDGSEKIVLHKQIPQAIIPRMSVKKLPDGKKFTFQNFNSKLAVNLNLNLPKSSGNETRLYLSETAGFKPRAGDYFFIFADKTTKDLVIGSVDEKVWIASGGRRSPKGKGENIPSPISVAYAKDDEDHIYQAEIYSTTPVPSKTGTYKREKRSRNVAHGAFKKASYKCEINPKHSTFLLENGFPYIEAHHLVPLSKQSELGVNLDVPENIVALCPNCHRTIHYSEKTIRIENLETLYKRRHVQLSKVEIRVTLSELARMYNCV